MGNHVDVDFRGSVELSYSLRFKNGMGSSGFWRAIWLGVIIVFGVEFYMDFVIFRPEPEYHDTFLEHVIVYEQPGVNSMFGAAFVTPFRLVYTLASVYLHFFMF